MIAVLALVLSILALAAASTVLYRDVVGAKGDPPPPSTSSTPTPPPTHTYANGEAAPWFTNGYTPNFEAGRGPRQERPGGFV